MSVTYLTKKMLQPDSFFLTQPVFVNLAKKAVFTFITIGAGLGLLGSSEAKAQNNFNLKQTVEADTLWATGTFQTINNETMDGVSGVSLSLRPIQMSMVIPDTTYNYITDAAGGKQFNLPVYIDSTVSINELLRKNTQVFPTIGSEINAYFPKVQSGTIELYDLSGKLVEKQEFVSDHAYVNLSRLATGMHIYRIKTPQGEFSDKFMKVGNQIKGPAQDNNSQPNRSAAQWSDFPQSGDNAWEIPLFTASVNSTASIGMTGLFLEEATYMASWVRTGFYTDSTEVVLVEGNMGFVNFFMTPIPGIPQHQDFTGTVMDGDNNYSPLTGALVTLEDVANGDTLWTITGSDGKFAFENLGLNKEYEFSVGNISGKQSHHNSTYFTPIQITQWNDTLANVGDAILFNLNGLTTQHIKDQTRQGSQQGVIEFYLGNSYNETEKAWLRNSFLQFQSDENNIHIFSESPTQLNNTGINIEYGTYNTQTDEEAIITPFGTLYRVLSATSTMGTGNYIGFVHEIKRAVAISEVSWYSVMRSDAPVYHQEDKDIGMFEGQYWKSLYEGMSNIDLNTITENIPIPAAAR